MKRLAMFTVALLAPMAGDAVPCVTPTHDPRLTVDFIQLVPAGFPAALGGVVTEGMDKWNNSSCNSQGADFSLFQLHSAGAGRVITVTYYDELNPDDNESCGNFAGNNIKIYSKSRSPQNGLIQSCGNADRLAETVAHELGHLLGLADQYGSNCQHYIMGQTSRTSNGQVLPKNIQEEECNAVDQMNLTEPETNPSSGGDPWCDANCWTSCEGGSCPSNPQWDAGRGSPILIDLNRDGFSLTGLENGVWFDLDSDQVAEITSWTRRGEPDAFLVYDRNGNGLIEDGTELFGNFTPLENGQRAPNGYVALREFDGATQGGNGDGWIGPEDWIFTRLQTWIDTDHSGTSEAWELYSLEAAGVLRVATRPVRTPWVDPYGNQFRYVGRAWIRDHRGRRYRTLTADVFFRALYPPRPDR